jgi:hypothetical protein
MLGSAQGRVGAAFAPAKRRELRNQRRMAISVQANRGDGERLRVVFISTEVAPW